MVCYRFVISLEELLDGEDIASCPSCTLRIRVIFDEDKLPALIENEDADEDANKVVEMKVN
jgi:diphthamide biosynthesis protein 3